MARILVTGGPVHAKLDAVKIVTNRFKGGRMAALAGMLARRGHEVVYLASNLSIPILTSDDRLKHVTHDGFVEYMDMVTELSPWADMAVMGAAVANLVPEPPWGTDQKFPSHDYREGDVVNVPFRVAPRVINLVKASAHRVTLVGFKLLSGVSDEELVRAAYTIVTDAKADLVVANDARNLNRKLLVTRERSVIEVDESTDGLVNHLDEMARDKHFATVWKDSGGRAVSEAMKKYDRVVSEHREEIERHGTVEGMVFGCVAVEVEGDGFLCSPRGKGSLDAAPVHVREVHHNVRHVVVGRFDDTHPKASLNAPLLARIFDSDPRIEAIVHTHQTDTGLSVLPYAPPGTVRDSHRKLLYEDFEIEGHGTFTRIMEGS